MLQAFSLSSKLAGLAQGKQDPAKAPVLDLLTGDDAKSASELVSASKQQPEGTPSAAAFTAVTQLLEACVANLEMPQLQDIVRASPSRDLTIIPRLYFHSSWHF